MAVPWGQSLPRASPGAGATVHPVAAGSKTRPRGKAEERSGLRARGEGRARAWAGVWLRGPAGGTTGVEGRDVLVGTRAHTDPRPLPRWVRTSRLSLSVASIKTCTSLTPKSKAA